jgi:hypothetical protein
MITLIAVTINTAAKSPLFLTSASSLLIYPTSHTIEQQRSTDPENTCIREKRGLSVKKDL